MDNKENRDRYLWQDIRAEDEKKEKNQDRIYYRHNRPFESMGEQNVLDRSSAYDESVDESRDFIERLNFLDIVKNENLFSALKKLKRIDIEIIVLRYRNGFSFKNIAVRLNMAYDTVKKRHDRHATTCRIKAESENAGSKSDEAHLNRNNPQGGIMILPDSRG